MKDKIKGKIKKMKKIKKIKKILKIKWRKKKI